MYFFFKQKTAYEMRISDWSSDVCSSDLAAVVARAVEGERGDVAVAGDRGGVGAEVLAEIEAGVGRNRGRVHLRVAVDVGHLAEEIGRASCRERVCQYV